jgi:cysteine-rich repeat protein
MQCVTDAQATICNGLVDGDRCDAGGTPGICDQTFCVGGCGDGVVSNLEECDDGDFESHDGCSSACVAENAGWREWQNPWRGRLSHAAAYDTSRELLIVGGGVDRNQILADGWIRDANGWRPVDPKSGRRYAAMAYDAARGKTVLFGGITSDNTVLADTWEFDGTTWTQVAPVASPPGRFESSIVFDASRGTIVLFGGRTLSAYLSDTWEYNGSTWTPVSVITQPAPRASHAMAYDPIGSRIVMVGGSPACDTWQFATGQWTLIPGSPACRRSPALAYQPSIGRVVMFGGLTSTGYTAETWELAGSTWTLQTLSVAPQARAFHTFTAAAGTYTADALVLVGGTDGLGTAFNDVWEYVTINAARQWIRFAVPFAPTVRKSPLVYDAKREQVVMFDGGGLANADTWSFDTHVWQPAQMPSAPSRRDQHALAYFTARERVVLFGGSTASGLANDTWLWDGAQWTQVSGIGPPARRQATMAEDRARGVVVLFGGLDAAGQKLGDTWEFDGTSWTDRTAGAPLDVPGAPTIEYDPISERMIMLDGGDGTWWYAGGAWQRLVTAHSPGARAQVTLAYQPGRQRLLLFGGNYGADLYTDAWELYADDWHPVPTAGEPPPPRNGSRGAFHVGEALLVIFGGTSNVGFLNDTWLFQYRSSTPNEMCANGSDDDGDKQVDARDPDCGP